MSEEGRTAHITGGASGLGRAVAGMLVEEGCRVLIADREADGTIAVAYSFNEKHQKEHHVAHSVTVDIAGWNSQAKVISQTLAHFRESTMCIQLPVLGSESRLSMIQHKSEAISSQI